MPKASTLIKGIIFDLGRVVVHDPDNEFIFGDIAVSCGLNYELVERTVKALIPAYQRGDLTDSIFWQQFRKKTGSRLPAPGSELTGSDLWSREFDRRLIVDEEVLGLVDRLKEKGYVTSALSNTIPPHVRIMESRGILKHFQQRVLSYEVGSRKPELKIYRTALERCGLKPEEVVFIDDILEYVNAARSLGILGIYYQGFKRLEEKLKSLGVDL